MDRFRLIKDELPWLQDNFNYQFDPYHINLIKELYDYCKKFDNITKIYVVGSWYGIHMSEYFKDKELVFIDRNRDYIKAIKLILGLDGINKDIVFDKIDFSDADLVIIPYAEEIMPLQHLDLNIKCPIVAAFTYHRYQRARNRNFSEPYDSVMDIPMENNKRVYLKKLGEVNDWIYSDIVTLNLL